MQIAAEIDVRCPKPALNRQHTLQFDDGFRRVRYHGGMTARWPYLALFALLHALPACNKPSHQKPIVVHVFRDLNSPYAHELDHRILEFQSTNPRLPSGSPVAIETINEMNYKSALTSSFDKNVKAEVVVLNSPADVVEVPSLSANLAKSTEICAAVKACPANVPVLVMANLDGDHAAASQIFVEYLGKQK